MPKMQLKIRFSPQAQRPAAAWLIPGSDPAGWLRELACWPVPHNGLRLRIVPHAAADLRPIGLLVSNAPAEVSPGGPCQPYGRLGDRLYLPAEALLDPPVSEQELDSLLELDGDYLFHPIAGLVRFDELESLAVSDLLLPPVRREAAWDGAHPGVDLPERLLSLKPAQVPSVEDVLNSGKAGIGNDADKLRQQAASEAAGSGVARLNRTFQRLLAEAVLRAVGRRKTPPREEAPEDAEGASAAGRTGRPGWSERLGDWAEQTLERLTNIIEHQAKAVDQLVAMLEDDPDQGLRYALPLASGRRHSGLAEPENSLPGRDVDFSLDRLGGRGPGRSWIVSSKVYGKLQHKYRELARRELGLGRYRRAAYIYGELLHDLESAVGALREGRHWREAAVLLRDQLKRPLEAAACLAEGGLWLEAIELYEQQRRFERAGDLYCEIGREADAQRLYRRAIASFLETEDFVAAARVYRVKLDSPDEAIQTLGKGWPHSEQRAECLRGILQMLGQLGRYEEAVDWIDTLRDHSYGSSDVTVCEVLAEAVRTYSDRHTAALAADAVRVKCSRLLAAGEKKSEGRLLQAIRDLAPDDRLLARDCQRYAEQRMRSELAARPIVPPRTPTLQMVARMELPPFAHWQTAIPCGEAIIAAGVVGADLYVLRCTWDGNIQVSDKLKRLEPDPKPVRLAASTGGDRRCVVVADLIEHERSAFTFPPTDRLPQLESLFIPSYERAYALLAIARDARRRVWTLWQNSLESVVLKAIDDDGQVHLNRCISLTAPHGLPWTGAFHLFPKPGLTYIAAGWELIEVRGANKIARDFFDVEHPIETLAASAPHTVPRIALGYADGVEVTWKCGDGHSEWCQGELCKPHVTFHRDGTVIAADDLRCECYTTGGGHVQRLDGMEHGAGKVLALIPSNQPSRFAILANSDELVIFEYRR